MSPQLKPFEGTDVQALLDEIRSDVGPDARISGAEKIRVGGVLGFFTRERYRVMVEVPSSGPGGDPVSLPRELPMSGIDIFESLAAATDDRNDVVTLGRWKDEVAAGVPGTASAHRSGPGAVLPCVEAPSAVAPSVEAPSAVAPSVEAPSVETPSVEAPSAVAPSTEAVPRSAADRVVSFDDVLLQVASTVDAPLLVGDGTRAAEAVAPAGLPGIDVTGVLPAVEPLPGVELPPDGLHVGRPPWEVTGPTSSTPASVPAPRAASTPEGAAVTDADGLVPASLRVERIEKQQRIAEALRLAGLQPDSAAGIGERVAAGADLEAQVVEAFTDLPVAGSLPVRAGSLIVVVGQGASARSLAATLAAEVGVDADAVPFASPDAPRVPRLPSEIRVRTAEEAAERAVGWRRYQVAVVAVEAPMVGPKRDWARHVVAALAPTAVWGTASATSKPEDIAAWATAVGGLDALCVEDVDSTVSPAAVLAAGIPVARLDGAVAGAARWAATVVDRLAPWR